MSDHPHVEPFALHLASGHRLGAELWRIPVPVRHAEPDGPQLELAFVRVPCTAEHAGAPIVWLEGGPGMPVIDAFPSWVDERFAPGFLGLLAHGDLLLLDQRGVGRSRPTTDTTLAWDIPLGRPGRREEMVEHARRRSRAWLRTLEATGIDVRAFTASASADDVDAVRRAVGAERIRLAGWSYGSHLGLAVIRRHGARVERAVLGMVEGPDHTHKLPSLVDAAVARVGELARAAGIARDLMDLGWSLRDRLERAPVVVASPVGRLALGGFDLQRAVAGCVGAAAELEQLPRRLAAMHAGNWAWLALETLERRTRPLGNAAAWHTDLASGATLARRARIRAERETTLLGDAVNFPFPDVEDTWGLPDEGEAFRAPLVSDVPVLLYGGDLDGRTPVSNLQEVAAGLPNGRTVVVEGASHDVGERGPQMLFAELHVPFLAGGPAPDRRFSVPFSIEP